MNKTITYNTPILYGDHHVLEIRRLLLDIEGVIDVDASSAFRIVDITYDTDKTAEEQITKVLDQAGYLGDWMVPMENGVPASLQSDRALSFFRHTEVYETSRQVVSFAQRVSYSGKPLWNCPGFGVIKNKMEE
jgi:copper chaperone CopZ